MSILNPVKHYRQPRFAIRQPFLRAVTDPSSQGSSFYKLPEMILAHASSCTTSPSLTAGEIHAARAEFGRLYEPLSSLRRVHLPEAMPDQPSW